MSRRLIIQVLTAVLLLAASDCAQQAARPAGIPQDAVKVTGTKGTGPWQWCEFKTDSAVHCKIYNVMGDIISDDEFVLYSGVFPKSIADLRISPRGDAQWIQLENGSILIPRSNQAEMTRFLDWVTGKRKER